MTPIEEYDILLPILKSRRDKIGKLMTKKMPKVLFVIAKDKVLKFRVLKVTMIEFVDTHLRDWYSLASEEDVVKLLSVMSTYFVEDVPFEKLWIYGHYGSRLKYIFMGDDDYLDRHNEYYRTRKEAKANLK